MKSAEPVVMSAAFGYNSQDLDLFLFSLRKHYKGTVIIVCNPTDNLAQAMEKYQIEVIPFSGELTARFPPAVLRYFCFDLILGSREFSDIFLTDSRDVLFQRSPFCIPIKNQVEFFLEPSLIEHCTINSAWIADVYTKEILNQISHNFIICSGTIRGSFSGISKAIRLICSEILSLDAEKLGKGNDQPIVNKLAYFKQIENSSLIANGTGLVQTFHHQRSVKIDRAARVLNADDSVCAVVHQYDRINFLNNVFKLQAYIDYKTTPPPHWISFEDLH